MKGIKYIIIVLAIIIVIAALFLVYSSNKNKENDVNFNENAANIDLGLSYLQECYNLQNVSKDNLSENLRACPSVTQEELDKLAVIQDIKGVVVCQSGDSWGNSDQAGYDKCNNLIKDCDIINVYIPSEPREWQQQSSISIADCSNINYLVFSDSPRPQLKIVEIKINDTTLNQLRG